jgi:hypothetical protein
MNSSSQDNSIKTLSEIFQPYQIVYIEHKETRLYGEVIQTVEQKQICWVRPLLLVREHCITTPKTALTQPIHPAEPQSWDVRRASDLLLPAALFQAAIDTDVLPLLANIHLADQALNGIDDTNATENNRVQQRYISQFIKEICSAYPEAF